MRGACTDSTIKPDVPLQGFEPPSSSSHVHIRYNLPVVLRPCSLQAIALSWASQWSKKVGCGGCAGLYFEGEYKGNTDLSGVKMTPDRK